MKEIRVCLYCRFAHEDQFVSKAQADLLKTYAQDAGWSIVGIFVDFRTGQTADRSGLEQVTQTIATGKANMVLVHSVTRIGRDRSFVESYVKLLSKYGAKLHCVKERLTLPER